MLTNVKYILLTALRDWLFIALFIGVIFATYISHILGSTALLEPEQMTLVFTAASSRAILITGLIVFVCFHMRNAFDTKEIDVLLSRPITRTNLVLSYWLGFAFVALLLAVPIIGMVGLLGILSENGFVAWAVSLLLEALFVVAIGLFASLTLRSATFSVLASFGFYILSRMMGFFVATTQAGNTFDNPLIYKTLSFIIHAVSTIIPRLDFFSKTEWLVYGVPNYTALYLFLAQAGIFVPLLLIFSIIDFRRRQF